MKLATEERRVIRVYEILHTFLDCTPEEQFEQLKLCHAGYERMPGDTTLDEIGMRPETLARKVRDRFSDDYTLERGLIVLAEEKFNLSYQGSGVYTGESRGSSLHLDLAQGTLTHTFGPWEDKNGALDACRHNPNLSAVIESISDAETTWAGQDALAERLLQIGLNKEGNYCFSGRVEIANHQRPITVTVSDDVSARYELDLPITLK